MKSLNTITQTTGRYLIKFLALAVIMSINTFSQKAQAQTVYKVTPGSEIKLSGTSSLHAWDMLATNFTCDANFIVKGGQLQDVSSLSFILAVTNLKSKEDGMDNRAYKALKQDQFKTINFKLTNATVSSQQKTMKATGNLTIAGVTNEVTIQTDYVLNSDGTITCKGSKSLKMSDYKIKQISMMLGALKTGDAVTIDILLKLKKSILITSINTKNNEN